MAIYVGVVFFCSVLAGLFLPHHHGKKVLAGLDPALKELETFDSGHGSGHGKKQVRRWLEIYKHNLWMPFVSLVILEYFPLLNFVVMVLVWSSVIVTGLTTGLLIRANLVLRLRGVSLKEKVVYFATRLGIHGLFELSGAVVLYAQILGFAKGVKPNSALLAFSFILLLIAAYVEEQVAPMVIERTIPEKIRRMNNLKRKKIYRQRRDRD